MRIITYEYNFIVLLSINIFLSGASCFSQQEEAVKPKTTFTASVDAYYATNFNDVPSTITYPVYHNDELSIGWLSAGILHEGNGYGFQANFSFGPKNDDFFKTGFYSKKESEFNYVRDAFAYFNLSEKTTFSAGLFQTYYGYELDDVHLNGNYSNGYIYALSSAGFMGAKVDFAIDDNWSLMVGVFNNVFQRELVEGNNNKAFTTNLAYGNDTFSAALTFLNSTEPDGVTLNLLDLVGAITISDQFVLGYNLHNLATSGAGFEKSLFAAALYPLITLSEKVTIGIRGEILLDEEGYYSLVADNSLYNFTLSLNYHISENIKLTPELRIDGASEKTFTDAKGELVSNDSFAVVGLTYQF